MAEDHLDHPAEHLVEQLHHLGGTGLLRQRGEAPQVPEEHRHLGLGRQHQVAPQSLVDQLFDHLGLHVLLELLAQFLLLPILLALLEKQTQRFTSGSLNPKDLLGGDPPAGVAPATAAGWTAVARVLLNLDETITKE